MAITAVEKGEGLSLTRDAAGVRHVKTYEVKGMTSSAAGIVGVMAQALTATGLPAYGDALNVNGHICYVRSITAKPWSDLEAEVTVSWLPPDSAVSVPTNTSVISVSTVLEQTETDFSAVERAKSFATRTPQKVSYTPAGTSPTVVSVNVRMPYLAQKNVISYTLTEATNPSALGRALAGKRNNASFLGLASGTVLCLSITGQSNDGGQSFQNTYSFAYDPDDRWLQTARYVDPTTGAFPVLTTADLAASNGIVSVDVQGTADFSALPAAIS